MDVFILRNKLTGWEGSVSERIYHDRLRNANEYEDPRGKAKSNPAPAPAVVPNKAPVALWEVVPKSPGWFDVARGDEIANEKSLREAAANGLRDQLNEAL